MIKHLRLLAALALLAAPTLEAQRDPAFELGIFGQYSKYDAFTKLENGIGAGVRFSMYWVKNLGLEWEGDFTRTKSSVVGDLTALNHRIDLTYYVPMTEKWKFLFGGGWTGTQYAT